MTTTTPPHRSPHRSHRRLAETAASFAVLLLALVAAGVVVAVGDRFHARADVTTTGEQQLAPRTLAVLDQVAALGEIEIVVAVDSSAVEPWSRQTVLDVLDLFGNAGNVRAAEIDIGSADGQARYTRLLQRLVDREQAGIDQHVETIAAASALTAETARALEQQLAPALNALGTALPGTDANTRAARSGLDQWAALFRVGSRQLAEAAARAGRALTEPDPSFPIPPLDDVETALRNAMLQRTTELEALAGDLDEVAALEGAAAASALADRARTLRDQLAREADALTRLPRLDVLRVAKALGAAEVALVIGPPGTGVTGIDIRTLYEPTIVAADGTRTMGDVRLRAEELLASAVSSVGSTARPIVVLTHGESRPILEAASFFSGIRNRLSQRGIDVAEWAASRDAEPPTLTDLDPDGLRPVVYLVLSPDSSASARNEDDLPGPERANALGRAVSLLLARREPVLISLNPSVLPSYGERDPIAAPLADLGIIAGTATPLLRRVADTRSSRVLTEFALRAPAPGDAPHAPHAPHSAHAILEATRNLPTALSWPIPLTTAPDATVTTTPLLTIDADPHVGNDTDTHAGSDVGGDPAIWGESQWLRLWQTPAEQRQLLPDPPRFDEGVDRRVPADGGPWVVALAATRPDQAENARSGRIVVVGSNAWFADPLAFAYETTDGRVALRTPGNAELFEAAILWLAGQDELIAASASARARPLIKPLDPGTLTALRWALVAGLPLLTLGLGIVWRIVRG
ncbi:MAG: hypothetical protein Q9O74_11310 [Planctomycetota bacterium]|nr:hypothetical protein [Planctomycetota bacterium]